MHAGLWAAVGLAAAPRLVMFARRIFIDIWITAFMSLTLMCFALSERYPRHRRLFLVGMYVSIGLGVLTKGPVAIALPGLAFALYLLMRKELPRIREMMIPLGTLIVAAIVVPWYPRSITSTDGRTSPRSSSARTSSGTRRDSACVSSGA